MSLAHQYGADRIWIVNVGDLKPMELPIEFFLRLAWNPDAITRDQIAEFTQRWAQREFGPTYAPEIADIVSKYAKYNAWRKPELLAPTTFSLTNYQEAERVLDAWQQITTRAERIYTQLPAQDKDAFYQLVLYPTKASAAVVELHIATGRNRLYAKQQRASTNACAARVRELFKLDQELSDYYNRQLAGGKWNHMMDQTRIGYTTWSDPKRNILPEVVEVQVPDTAALGVAIEGSELSWPGGKGDPTLPTFDSLNQQRYPIDVFNRGGRPFEFTAVPTQPWIKLSKTAGTVDADERLWVSIDWNVAPIGSASGTVEVSRKDGEKVSVALNAVRAAGLTRESLGALGGLTGPTAIAAQDATTSVEANGARWERIPDYGRGRSGMAVFPVTAPSVLPPQASPHLEYKVFLPQPGEVSVDLITGATLDFMPERGLRLAVSFDGETPHIVDAYANRQQADREWGKMVSDNVRTMKSTHTIAEAGVHTLKIWMVDPGVVLEKVVVHTDDVRPSYFGPPESPALH
jgi:Gylcosyl hydrolase family 115 C-terminal domain/Glycosyl hydrolase family 115